MAQCSDLEALLSLAKREALAAEKSDFRELVAVVQDRATLGERLEIYHRQIAELRASMSGSMETPMDNAVTDATVRLAIEIQALDARTTALLTTTRTETREAISRLDHGRRFVAYLSDSRGNGFNCDRLA